MYRFGRLSGHPNCGPEALREDDGAVMLEAFDRLAAQAWRREMEDGMGWWSVFGLLMPMGSEQK